jgi:hypothetical protein
MITWLPVWAHIFCALILLGNENYVAAWLAGVVAFFAYQAIICRQGKD